MAWKPGLVLEISPGVDAPPAQPCGVGTGPGLEDRPGVGVTCWEWLAGTSKDVLGGSGDPLACVQAATWSLGVPEDGGGLQGRKGWRSFS